MARVFVHIGVPKTGTTAIQSFLHRNCDRLAELGFYYAPTLPALFPNHNPLAEAFRHRSPPQNGPRLLAGLLDRAGSKTVIISSEMLSSTRIDVSRFLSCLKDHDTEVIAYLRHPCDIVISAFQEVVRDYKTSWTHDINEAPFAYAPGQRSGLREWLDLAPKATIAPYDPAQWAGQSIIEDFLSMAGVPLGGFEFPPERTNAGLPYPLAEALRGVNKISVTKEQHMMLVAHFRTIKCLEDEYPLKPETVAYFLTIMRNAIPKYRPFFRSGFQEAYLLEQRPVASQAAH